MMLLYGMSLKLRGKTEYSAVQIPGSCEKVAEDEVDLEMDCVKEVESSGVEDSESEWDVERVWSGVSVLLPTASMKLVLIVVVNMSIIDKNNGEIDGIICGVLFCFVFFRKTL